MMDDTKFGIVMQTLAEVYGRQATPLMLEGYWDALSDLRDDEVAAAARLAMRTCKYMPTPADIRGLVREVRANRLAANTTKLIESERDIVPATREELEGLRQRS